MPKLKFLVVEDDLFYQTYVNDLLAETGVDILNATDGEAGLALAIAEVPDLIITDIEIPKIQGFVFFKTLRERPETRDIPVIMMSGKVEKALLDRHSGLSVHAEGYLVKPFSGQVLIDMIRDIIGEDFGFSDIVISPDIEEGSRPPDHPDTEDGPEITQFPESDPKPVTGGKELTVLVVDDSRYICDITRDFLEELGVSIKTASDGETGYQMACDLLPDLVLLDVQMPNLNGFVVCEMLRKKSETKNIPIILMSAVVDDESFQRHSKLRYHADAYLQKPFMKSELHELVRRFTSLGDGVQGSVESKTGFFVPPEEAVEPVHGSVPISKKVDAKITRELEQAQAELKEMADRESQLETSMEGLRKEKDQLEAELFELKKSVEGTQGSLQDKLTLVTQRFEEARGESEKLAEENRLLHERLDTASRDDGNAEKMAVLESELKKKQEELDAQAAENAALKDKLQETDSVQDLRDQLTDLGAKLQETSALALEMENRNKLLEKEMGELREKSVSVVASVVKTEDSEELQKKIEALTRDLTAAIAAKKEIEDQARSLLETGDRENETAHVRQELEKIRAENQDLQLKISLVEEKSEQFDDVKTRMEQAEARCEELGRQLESAPADASAEIAALREELSSALGRAESLEKEKGELSDSLRELKSVSSGYTELKKQIEGLKGEVEESRKLAASETQARMDLEGKLASQAEEKALIEGELEEAKRQLDDHDEADETVAALESRLEAESKLRASAEGEVEVLKSELEEFSSADKNETARLEKENEKLKAALSETRKRCEQLEKEAQQRGTRPEGETSDTQSAAPYWEERFRQLEETLGKTVQEAQTILKDQKDRESALEESVVSLMRSLEEERSSYKKEREAWSSQEGELRNAFEDALRESRRLMGEEAARLYPMHIPRRSRPLEVVTRTSKYAIAAAAAVAALVLFAGGYMVKSRTAPANGQGPTQAQSQTAAPEPGNSAGKPPEPWIARSRPEDSYEELWRRNTVQSVSDDMMIQATLHTWEELEAAIKYTAQKEGWTRERIQKAMSDMAKTYNLSGSYYITVYSKNLKSGYPGYADSFEKHIALRDHSGKEVRAHLPGELEDSKFITSRVSAAGKEMNPVFLYEVGLTVAFERKTLVDKPEGLQLVLYDIGAVPMRVLTWDLSSMGSLSYLGSEKEILTGS